MAEAPPIAEVDTNRLESFVFTLSGNGQEVDAALERIRALVAECPAIRFQSLAGCPDLGQIPNLESLATEKAEFFEASLGAIYWHNSVYLRSSEDRARIRQLIAEYRTLLEAPPSSGDVQSIELSRGAAESRIASIRARIGRLRSMCSRIAREPQSKFTRSPLEPLHEGKTQLPRSEDGRSCE